MFVIGGFKWKRIRLVRVIEKNPWIQIYLPKHDSNGAILG